MALSESALSELRAAIDVGQGGDLIRQLAEWTMQQLVEAEAADKIGAGRYERTVGRTTERNGHRPRVLSTKAGDLALKIPKLREGSFFPSILEPRRRIDQALYAVVMEAYVQGVSTRSVDDLVAALGIDTGISKSQVSRICAELDARVAAFRNRTLGARGCQMVCVSGRGGCSSQARRSRPGKKISSWLRASRQCQVALEVSPKRSARPRLRTAR